MSNIYVLHTLKKELKLNKLNKFSLENKKIIITGASSGIGKSCAIECNRAGAKIVLIGRNEERLKLVINELDGDNRYFSFDVTNFSEIRNLVDIIFNNVGKIDGFIHSAGVELTKPFSLTKPEDYENLYKVNVISGFEFARIISSKKYINENGVSFIFISSVMGSLGVSGKISYCATKGALIAGVKSMALELAQKNIRANCISPAVIDTDLTRAFIEKLPEEAKNEMYKMHPLGVGKPEDVANACIYLLSEEAKWITGSNLVIDGGYSAK